MENKIVVGYGISVGNESSVAKKIVGMENRIAVIGHGLDHGIASINHANSVVCVTQDQFVEPTAFKIKNYSVGSFGNSLHKEPNNRRTRRKNERLQKKRKKWK